MVERFTARYLGPDAVQIVVKADDESNFAQGSEGHDPITSSVLDLFRTLLRPIAVLDAQWHLSVFHDQDFANNSSSKQFLEVLPFNALEGPIASKEESPHCVKTSSMQCKLRQA